MQLNYRGVTYTGDNHTAVDATELVTTGSYRGCVVHFNTAQRASQPMNITTMMWRGHRALGVH